MAQCCLPFAPDDLAWTAGRDTDDQLQARRFDAKRQPALSWRRNLMDNPPLVSADPRLVREAMARRLHRRSVVGGQISLSAVPGMIDVYLTMCDNIFAAVGRRFTAEQLDHFKSVLEGQMAEAYAASQRSSIVTSIGSPPASHRCSARNRMPGRGRWPSKHPIPRRIGYSTSAPAPAATPWPWPAAATPSMWSR